MAAAASGQGPRRTGWRGRGRGGRKFDRNRGRRLRRRVHGLVRSHAPEGHRPDPAPHPGAGLRHLSAGDRLEEALEERHPLAESGDLLALGVEVLAEVLALGAEIRPQTPERGSDRGQDGARCADDSPGSGVHARRVPCRRPTTVSCCEDGTSSCGKPTCGTRAAPAPIELLDIDRSGIFTFPDVTENRLAFVQGRASVTASDVWSVQVTGYYRDLDRSTLNGDEAEFDLCDDDLLPPGAAMNHVVLGRRRR